MSGTTVIMLLRLSGETILETDIFAATWDVTYYGCNKYFRHFFLSAEIEKA
jgi:hypothetical protein